MDNSKMKKVPFSQKIAYGMGQIANNFLGNGITQLALPVYNIGLGVSASLIGLALGIPRIWDAISDPLMGHISDNTRSRWGRRRLYILIGGIGSGLAFALLWNPGHCWSKAMLFAFFLAVSMIYYTFSTIWGVPYGALGFEMSYDYNERTSIQAYGRFFVCVFGFCVPWMYKMCFWSWDKLVASDAGPLLHRIAECTRKSTVAGAEINGAGVVGIIFGLVILITAIIPVLCKEKVESQSQKKMPFIKAVKSTLSNKPYLIITMTGLFAFIGLFLVSPLALYVNIYYVYGGDRDAAAMMNGWFGTAFTLLGILSLPLATAISKRMGKKTAMIFGLGFTALGYLLAWWLLTPANPWLQLITAIFIGPAWNVCMVVMPSMIADLCDLDELETGMRREGMYGAINSWIQKMGIAAATCLTGVVVTLSGVNPKAVTQTATTILKMRLMYVGMPVVFLGLAVLAVAFYSVSEHKVREVRAILDARKAGGVEQVEPAEVV